MKKIVLKDLLAMGASILLVVILFNLFVYQYYVSDNFKERSEIVFSQISSLIENHKEENEINIHDFNGVCIERTQMAAYMIKEDPTILNSIERLEEIANILDAKEIHIFNRDGVLYAGTEPIFYGLTLNSGKQMQFFLPLLEDKELELCQEVTENTSRSELMKYAAVWVDDEIGIIQLGFAPGRFADIENKVPIESLIEGLVVSNEIEILALDKESGKVLEASDDIFEGVSFYDLVQDFEVDADRLDTFVFKDSSYRYIAKEIDDYYIVRTFQQFEYVKMILFGVLSTTAYIAMVLVLIVAWIFAFINQNVIKNLNTINGKLDEIVGGNTDIALPHSKVKEFDKLNSNINKVVSSLITYVRKISIVFDLTKTKIGIIDYPDNATKITITGNVKDILGINKSDYDYLIKNPTMLKDILNQYRDEVNLVDDNVYRLINFDGEYRYVSFEDLRYENSNIVIVRDVTEERNEILHLENERDTDILTNVLNRRAFINELSRLFEEPSKLAFGYFAIADIDGLKEVNDNYGHLMGDEMIVKVAKSMKNFFDGRKAVFARVGGDEFAIFEYGFNTKEEVEERVDEINRIKDMQTIMIDNIQHPIRFSIGHAIFPIDSSDYQVLLHLADESMYNDKRIHKNKNN